MTPLDLRLATRLLAGPGAIERVGEHCRQLGGNRVLLVTDPGLVSAGHPARVINHLRHAGLEVFQFAEVMENPTTRCVEACVELARAARVDLLVGLGGGSAMDTAKGCNFLLTNGGRMQDYWGVGKATKPMLPMVAIPTTAGTGSECQSAALITDETTHQKMACLDPKAAPRIAVLDPALTLSMPPRVTAQSGIDALVHALESSVTRRRSAWSGMLSLESFRLLSRAFPRVLADPGDLQARGDMLLGAALAGMAIEASMLGAAHAAANPLTAHHGLAHGIAVGLMIPGVLRFNAGAEGVDPCYESLARAAELVPSTGYAAAAALASFMEGLLVRAGMPGRLSDCGVQPGDLPRLAEEAARQWTAQFNPRAVAAADFAALYEGLLDQYRPPPGSASLHPRD